MNESDRPEMEEMDLDLLVDGELSEEERRALLASLDSSPDGWRRCALAFLEAQCWKRSLSALPPVPPGPSIVPPKKERNVWPRFTAPLAMAASFLLALVLGLAVNDLFGPGASRMVPADLADSGTPRHGADVAPLGRLRQLDSPPSAPFQFVTLPIRDPQTGDADLVRLPIIPGAPLDQAWLDSVPFAVPDSVIQSLRRQGHAVRQQRRMVPCLTEDGRSVVFPVDEVELQYVGHPGYQ